MADTGYWILDTGYWMLDTGCWILDTGCWILNAGYWVLDAGYCILDTGWRILGCWCVESKIITENYFIMSYRNLDIWKLAREVVIETHAMTMKLSKFEQFEGASKFADLQKQ